MCSCRGSHAPCNKNAVSPVSHEPCSKDAAREPLGSRWRGHVGVLYVRVRARSWAVGVTIMLTLDDFVPEGTRPASGS